MRLRLSLDQQIYHLHRIIPPKIDLKRYCSSTQGIWPLTTTPFLYRKYNSLSFELRWLRTGQFNLRPECQSTYTDWSIRKTLEDEQNVFIPLQRWG